MPNLNCCFTLFITCIHCIQNTSDRPYN
jgi:hypothetical protein